MLSPRLPVFVYVDVPIPEGGLRTLLSATRYAPVKIQKSTLGKTMRTYVGERLEFEETTQDKLADVLKGYGVRPVIVWPARVAVLNLPYFHLLLEKLCYAVCPVNVRVGEATIYMGPANMAATEAQGQSVLLEQEDFLIALDSMADLQKLFSSNIHSRHFNQVIASGETIRKSSSDVAKIKAEYTFLSTVPEEMQQWFVTVEGYGEAGGKAFYTMPKLPMLDASIGFINGTLRGKALEHFLRDVGRYLEAAHGLHRAADEQTYDFIAEKCLKRLKELKAWEHYAMLDAFIARHTHYAGVEEAFGVLMVLLGKEKKRILSAGQVFSHGDLCLSNMLYDGTAGILKMIDPRGGEASASYRSPYYDLAKLSHSLLGGYDPIVNGVAVIRFDDAMQARVDSGLDNDEAVQPLLEGVLKRTGLSFPLVRLVEASLFLSMLPLHVENVRKMHMLALRATEVLDDARALLEAERRGKR